MRGDNPPRKARFESWEFISIDGRSRNFLQKYHEQNKLGFISQAWKQALVYPPVVGINGHTEQLSRQEGVGVTVCSLASNTNIKSFPCVGFCLSSSDHIPTARHNLLPSQHLLRRTGFFRRTPPLRFSDNKAP